MDYSDILEQVAGPAPLQTPTPPAVGGVPAPDTPPLPATAPQGGIDYLGIIDQVTRKLPNPDRVSKAMYEAQGKNPEEEARRANIAKQLGTQPVLLPSTKEAEALLERRKNDPLDISKNSPATAKWLEDNAHLARGSVDRFRKMESVYQDIEYLSTMARAGGRFALGAAAKLAETVLQPAMDDQMAAQLAKGDPAKFEQLRQQNVIGTFAREQQQKGGEIVKGISPALKEKYGRLEYMTTDPERAAYREPVKVIGDVFQSLPSNLMLGMTFFLTKGAGTAARLEALARGETAAAAEAAAVKAATKVATAVGAISDGVVTYAQNSLGSAAEVEKRTIAQISASPEYQKYLELGYDPTIARSLMASDVGKLSGSVSGMWNALVSGIGGKYLGRILGKPGSTTAQVGKSAVLGSAEEFVQSPVEKIAENVAIRQIADPTQDPFAGAGEAAVQGLVVGAVSGGGMGFFASDNRAAETAMKDRRDLERLTNEAAGISLRDNAPDAFKSFVNLMTEDGRLAEVYVDTDAIAGVFNQTGTSMKELERALPDVAEQLKDDTNSDGFVRIKTSDLVTHIKNPEVMRALLDNAKVDPDGKTFLESQEFFQSQQARMETEAEALSNRKMEQEKYDAEVKEIRKRITDELTNAGRSKPEAAANAIPLTAFYVTQARRFKMSPLDLFNQETYRAQKEQDTPAQPGQEFAQGEQPRPPAEPATVEEAVAAVKRVAEDPINKATVTEDEKSITVTVAKDSPIVAALQESLPPVAGTDIQGDTITFKMEKGEPLRKLAGRIGAKLKAAATTRAAQPQQAGENLASFNPTNLMTTFLEGANLTSTLHESGHFYLEMLRRLSLRPDAPAEVVSDFNKIMDWFGVTPEQWSKMSIVEQTPYHEQFAQSQELWMLEGVAPTLDMQPVFTRFRRWMLEVYRSVEQFLIRNPLAGALNDEVRAVFDRLLASEEAIAEAQQVRGYVPLFKSAAEAGMSEKEYQAYLQQDEDATRTAVEDMQRRSLRDMKWLSNAKSKVLKDIQAKAKALRDAIREEVTQEVMDEPINRARHFLRTGETIDPMTGQVSTAEVFKLRTADVKEIATDGKVPPQLKTMVAADGLHPDAVASMFGFPSGDALFWRLSMAESAIDKINGLTDQRMLERHGEMIDARAIEETANAAVVNAARERFLATGLTILTKTKTPVGQLVKAARIAAENAIGKLRVSDLRPNQYLAAERRANRDALKYASSDPARAIRAQRAALLNNQLYKVAIEVQEEVQAGLARAKRITRPAAQKAMGGEHLLQLNALLRRFDMGGETAPIADRTQNFESYLSSEAAALSAIAPDIPAWISNELVAKPYNTLSISEFRELMAAVRGVETLARRERHQYMAIRDMTFQQEKQSILDRLRQFHPANFLPNGKPKPLDAKMVPSLRENLAKFGEKFYAEFLNAEAIINKLEGGQFGALHESLLGRLSQRTDWKATKLDQVYAQVKPLFAQYSLFERRAFSRKDIGQSIGIPVTRENALVVALLHGNKEGRDRLANYGWNEATQKKIIGLLDERDVKLANGIWELFDENLWPELKALNERTRGKAPPKVEAMPYSTRSGEMRGGYFKIKYSSDLDNAPQGGDEAIQELMGVRAGGMATTEQGSSQARDETVKKRPRLDFGVFAETVNETVHDLAFREAVADTHRLLTDRDIQMVLKSSASPAEYASLVARVGEVATRARNPNGMIEKALNLARKNTVVTLMSGIPTALQNFTGILPVMARVENPMHVAAQIAKYPFNGIEMTRFASEKSEYIRNRHKSYDRSLQEEQKKLTTEEGIMPSIGTWLWLMSAVDKLVSVPVWTGAYKEGMARFSNDDAKAVAYADHIVRQTQGSGRELDVPQVMTGQLRSVFTMFYSYFNAQLGLLVRSGAVNRRLAETNPALAVARFTKDFLLIVALPAMLTAMLFKPKTDEDWDETPTHKYGMAILMYGVGMFPLLRDAVSAWMSYFDQDIKSYGYKITPIEAGVTGVGKGAKALWQILNDEGDDNSTKEAIMGVSYAVGLPGVLVQKAVTGFDAWMNDEAGPEAMIFGPPKK